MGLLDDAIKQHLELKRKHGATEDEVKRQESEALGPARRDFAAPVPDAAAPAVADGAEPAVEAPREPTTWLDEDEPAPVAPTELIEPEPEPEPVPEPVLREDPSPLRAEPPAPVAPLREHSDTPTQGFDALSADEADEEAAEDDPAAEDEDVLEETPEFLQDTPEHDRLWFEQKPPRDFDFDG